MKWLYVYEMIFKVILVRGYYSGLFVLDWFEFKLNLILIIIGVNMY